MIYFVQPVDGGHIKIGTTIRLSQRLRALASEYGTVFRVLAVCDGSYAEEKALHRRFAHLNVANELFEPGDDLLGFIVTEGRKWDGSDEAPPLPPISARIDPDIISKARYLAAQRGEPLFDYLNARLRPVVEREFLKEAKKLLGGDE